MPDRIVLAYSVDADDAFMFHALRAGEVDTRGLLFEQVVPEIASAFEANLARLARAGAAIADCTVDDLIEGLAEATRIGSIAGIEASRVHAD